MPGNWGDAMRRVLIGAVVVAVFFGGTLWALDFFFGDSPSGKRPALAEPPPLKPVSRMSTIIAPIAIANDAIRDVMEAQAPRNLTGKRDNPLTELLGKADIGWNMNRGPLAVAGRTDGMAIATTITGELRATGQIGEQAGQLTSQLGSMIGGSLGRQVGQLAGKPFDQKLDINGNVDSGREARAAAELADRAQPHRQRRACRPRHEHLRHQAQRDAGGEAAARPHRERADGEAAGAAAQRPDAGADRTARMGRNCAARSRSGPQARTCRRCGSR